MYFMVSFGLFPPHITPLLPHKNFSRGFPQSQFYSIQLKRSTMPQTQNSGACKKLIKIPLSGGEVKHMDMYAIMNMYYLIKHVFRKVGK